MPTKKLRSIRRKTTLAGELMLAPAVIAMRMPLLAAEAKDLNPFVGEMARAYQEKALAMAQGVVAAQLSLAQSMTRSWFELASGRVPSMMDGSAFQAAAEAALRPAGRQVQANFRRLSLGRKSLG